MIPSPVDHVATGILLLIDQFRELQVTQGLLESWLREVQSLEDVLHQIIESRNLTAGIGAQLDGIGTIVGEQRLGRTDLAYRTAIRLRILVNRSNATTESILNIIKTILGAVYFDYTETGTARFMITTTGSIPADLMAELRRFLIAIRPAGVALDFETLPVGLDFIQYDSPTQDFGAFFCDVTGTPITVATSVENLA